MIGNLIYSCKSISEKEFERDCNRNFAWVVDKLESERDQSITINVSKATLNTQAGTYNLINVPGKEDTIKNTMTGASNCDACVLVVSAADGEYEESFSSKGLIKRHILLAFTLGVKQMVVSINKIEEKSVNYSQKRYEEISRDIYDYAKKVGYNPD